MPMEKGEEKKIERLNITNVLITSDLFQPHHVFGLAH